MLERLLKDAERFIKEPPKRQGVSGLILGLCPKPQRLRFGKEPDRDFFFLHIFRESWYSQEKRKGD